MEGSLFAAEGKLPYNLKKLHARPPFFHFDFAVFCLLIDTKSAWQVPSRQREGSRSNW